MHRAKLSRRDPPCSGGRRLAWFFNLRANPDTTIEIGSETVEVHAAEITGDDYEQTWARVTAAMPGFADYQTKTARRIPLVSLHRKDGQEPAQSR